MATTAAATTAHGLVNPQSGASDSEQSIVDDWLKTLHLGQYAESFVDNGYDDLEICKQIGEPDLDAIGVLDPNHRQTILRAVRVLLEQGGTAVYFTLEECHRNSAVGSAEVAGMFDFEGTDNYACDYGGESPSRFGVSGGYRKLGRKYVDEYEEGKAELVRFPKLQLKVFVRDKLIRDGIRLSAFPYSNTDGSRGHLETLAVRYAQELRTHYQDVLERLEELRKRRVAIDVPPVPVEDLYGRLEPAGMFKPGKYSPSSCLSDHEEENLYEGYTSAAFRSATLGNNNKSTPILNSPASPAIHTQRCISPRSRLFYESCPLTGEVRENGDTNIAVVDQNKKHRSGLVGSGVLAGVAGGGLGKLFRSLGSKKDKIGSPKAGKGTLKATGEGLTVDPHYGFTLRLGGHHYDHQSRRNYLPVALPSGESLLGADERVQLLRMVRDGYLTMEEAVHKIRSRQVGNSKDKYPEVIAELGRGGFLAPSAGRKVQQKPSSVFYSDHTGFTDNYYEPSANIEEPQIHSVSAVTLTSSHENQELVERLTFNPTVPNPHPVNPQHHYSATLATPTRRTQPGAGRGQPVRAFTQEEFTSAILARTQVTLGQRLSSSGETREPCSGQCGNIMCSLSATSVGEDEDATERPQDGSSIVVETLEGTEISECVATEAENVTQPEIAQLSSIGEAPTAVFGKEVAEPLNSSTVCSGNDPPTELSMDSAKGTGNADYASSPVLERRSKSSVLGKIRSLTNRSSYSTSEEGHSQSSDCEDGEETHRLGSRDSGSRASSTSFAGRVRDLHRDVKRRISKLRGSSRSAENENSRENDDGLIEAESSMESIPSGSCGSRSSLQAHTPTSSNRSSSSAGEDETNSVIGPILGRARALVDVTPSPYDRDGLALKKGDIIDIIAKNNTGTWVGIVHGKVGHFKFINVEEIALESKARRRQRRSRQSKQLENMQNVSETQINAEDTTPAETRWQPANLEELLEVYGLQDCMNVLMLHGYGDLETFREIEKDDLNSLGITSPSLQQRLLRAAEMLFEEEDIEESEEGLNSLDTVIPQNNGHPSLISQISSETVISTNNLDGLEDHLQPNGCFYNRDDQSTLNGRSDDPHSQRNNASDFRPNISIAESNETRENGHLDEAFRIETELSDSNESTLSLLRTTAQILKSNDPNNAESSLSYSVRMEDFDFGENGRHPIIGDQILNKNSQGKMAPPIPKRTTPTVVRPSKFLDEDLEVNCNGGTSFYPRHQDPDDYGVPAETRAKSATLPRKKVSEINDADLDAAVQRVGIVERPDHHSIGSRLLEKKLYKKFGQRKGSLQAQTLKNPRPPSLSLLTAVYRKLEDEGIDLGIEPYTDKTGFCGIPPALVQRYAEELQRDVYDIAESMDQARINSLQMRGRRGVPNDFLADACYGPVVEANYSGTLWDWLISLGLPMYEEHLQLASCTSGGIATHHLERVASLRDADLRHSGIRNARHIRLLTTAIGALNIHLGRLGGMC